MKFKNVSGEKVKVTLPMRDNYGRKKFKTIKVDEVFEVEFGIGQESIFKKVYKLKNIVESIEPIKKVLPKVETKDIKGDDGKELSPQEKRALTIARKKAEAEAKKE